MTYNKTLKLDVAVVRVKIDYKNLRDDCFTRSGCTVRFLSFTGADTDTVGLKYIHAGEFGSSLRLE